MAGTWMSIVEGFGGMRVRNNQLCFEPRIPSQSEAYSFKVNFRHQILKVMVTQKETRFELDGNQDLKIFVHNKKVNITPHQLIAV
jgi:maltose phosphorylase